MGQLIQIRRPDGSACPAYLSEGSNAPNAPGFAPGQQVSVRDRQVVDWGYWRAGTLVGGATMRVLIARMDPKAARAMLDRFGW